MKKIFMAILTAVFLMPSAVWGDRLLNENFDYATGNLYQCGKAAAPTTPKEMGWIKYSTNTVSPIQVIDESLVKSGYQTEGQGKAIELTNANLGEDLQIAFTNTAITSGVVYASMLVKVTAPTDKTGTYFAAFAGTNYSNKTWQDGMGGTDYCRLFVKQNSTTGKFNFGISRSSTTTVDYSDCNIGETYLVIMKYDFGSGLASAWINPTNVSNEPASTISSNNGSSSFSSTYGITGVQLRQGTNASYTAATMTIDALRVATTWADLFDGEGGEGGEGDPDPTYNKYECASISALIAQETSDAADTCVLTANALVTYVSGSTVYIEDANSAICLKNVNPAPAVGDIISDIRGTKNGKILSLTKDISIVSNGNAVNAQTVTANVLNTNAEDYRYKFVKINEVSFVTSGKFYGTGFYKMNQDGTEIWMSVSGSALVGENIPTEIVNIYGFGSSDSNGFFLQASTIETIEQDAPVEINADMNDEALEELNGSTVNVLVNRNFTANMYNTICLPFAMSEGQINDVFGSATRIFGMTGASLENDELVITFSTPLSSIAAGVPYLIWPENNITEPWQVDNVTITNVAQTNSNETIDFIGVLVPTMVEADHANLFVGANNKLHYNTASGNIQGMRAYFQVKDPKAVMAPARITRQTDTTTDIESTEDAMHAQKLLNEGRVIIRIEGHDYDLKGTMIR